MAKIDKGICSDCSILSGRWTLRNATDLTEIDPKKVYIHHFVSIVPSHKIKEPIKDCRSKPDGFDVGMFIERGQDSGNGESMFVSTNKSVESGFRFGPSPQISLQYELVNYQEATDVVIDLEIEWMEGVYGSDVGQTLNSVSWCYHSGQSSFMLQQSIGRIYDAQIGIDTVVTLNIFSLGFARSSMISIQDLPSQAVTSIAEPFRNDWYC